jgi:hypothetical protein
MWRRALLEQCHDPRDGAGEELFEVDSHDDLLQNSEMISRARRIASRSFHLRPFPFIVVIRWFSGYSEIIVGPRWFTVKGRCTVGVSGRQGWRRSVEN